MANTTNLEKARIKLDKTMLEHEGSLTSADAINYLEVIATEFNLDEEKINMLKSFNYQRVIEIITEQEDKGSKIEFSHDINKENVIDINQNEEHELTTEQRLAELEVKHAKLVDLVSKIAVLTGNGNHLREYGIERWMPGKKDMNKYA